MPDTPDLAAVIAARDAQDAAGQALRVVLMPEQQVLLETLLDAVEQRYRSGWWHLAGRLAELLPGSGPAVRFIADELEGRIDLAPLTTP